MPTDPSSNRRAPAAALGFLALVVLCALAPGCRDNSREFRVGYMICNSLAETRERFGPLTAYLSEAAGARFTPVYLDTVDVEDAFSRGDLDFTHTNSLLYVALHERHQARLIAAEKRGAFGARTRGVIIARADSPIQHLEDVRGKRMVFGPQWAPFGFLAQYHLLLQAGIDPERAIGYYAIPAGTWKHEKIIYSVLYGAFDVGAAPLIDLEEMVGDGRIGPYDFRVLAETELAPYCTFAAASHTDPEWVERVRDALVRLDGRATAQIDGEELYVLKRALVDGFEQVPDADYDILRQWARRAGLPPYEIY